MVAGAAPRDGRQRLAHVLTGQSRPRPSVAPERSADRSLVRGRVPPTTAGLHASASPSVSQNRPSDVAPFSSRGGARNALGHLLSGFGVVRLGPGRGAKAAWWAGASGGS